MAGGSVAIVTVVTVVIVVVGEAVAVAAVVVVTEHRYQRTVLVQRTVACRTMGCTQGRLGRCGPCSCRALMHALFQ